MRPRFSIRTLLVLTALAAAACYWWISAPTQVALRFKQAVESADYRSANAMFLEANKSVRDMFTRDPDTTSAVPAAGLTVRVLPRSWTDLVRRERRLAVSGSTGEESFRGSESRQPFGYALMLVATPSGIIDLNYVTLVSRL